MTLLNTIAPLLTVIIVAATAIAALVQLRHLSAANQINAMMETGKEMNDKEFHQASYLIRQGLGAAMQDPVFRDYLVAYNRGQHSSDVDPAYLDLHRAALLVGNKFEECGVLVRSGVIRRDLFLHVFGWLALKYWRQLSQLNSFAREAAGQAGIWENFEYLAMISEDWTQRHLPSYPKGARRMSTPNPWPVGAPAAADGVAQGEPAPQR